MANASTDWGSKGITGFARDTANEQTATLAPNAVFTGGWTRIDSVASLMLLYGTHVPFTMQIQWSADGITRDTDPFATITPQVRFALGLYSVISPQSTFFRPYYRIVIINGPSQQFFVVSDALLLNTIFPGYQIGVDGPIPVLGLANLNIGLQWGRTPTDWQPVQLTELKNQKIALAENLLGTLPVSVSGPVSLDAAALAALESVTVMIDAASLAQLESISVQNNVSTDMLDRAGRLLGVVSGTVNIGNFPAPQPISGTVEVTNFPDTQPVSGMINITNFPATQPVSGTVGVNNFPAVQPVSAASLPLPAGAATEVTLAALLATSSTGGNFTHLLNIGTTVVKSGAGVLERVVVNRISAAAVVLLTLYDSLVIAGPQIAVVQIGATAPGSSGVIGPISLDYFLKFTTGLTANISAVGADVTLVWR